MIELETNLPDFNRQLVIMTRKVRRQAVRRSVAATAGVFKRVVKQQTPVVTGTLKRAIYFKRSPRSNAQDTIYYVSARKGSKYGKNRKSGKNKDAYYWAWVEAGHLVRGPGQKLKGGERSRALQRSRLKAGGAKETKPADFLKDGFRIGKGPALAKFNQTMEKEVAKIDRTT